MYNRSISGEILLYYLGNVSCYRLATDASKTLTVLFSRIILHVVISLICSCLYFLSSLSD